MDRLAIFLAAISGSSIAGALVIACFAMGYYSIWAILVSCLIGLAMAYPVGHFISRRIKRRDPEWRPDEKSDDSGFPPKPGAPEV